MEIILVTREKRNQLDTQSRFQSVKIAFGTIESAIFAFHKLLRRNEKILLLPAKIDTISHDHLSESIKQCWLKEMSGLKG